jgi:hypothetical protein
MPTKLDNEVETKMRHKTDKMGHQPNDTLTLNLKWDINQIRH